MAEIPELTDARFAELFEGKTTNSRASVQKKRSAEAGGMAARDGRIKTTVNTQGLAQLNVRLPPDLKNQVYEEALASGRKMAEVVIDILQQHFRSISQRRG